MSVTVTTQQIVATATVGAHSVTATTTGGVGPQGPAGVAGDALSSANDVALQNVAEGDVLRYSNNKWRNRPEAQLIDGGNY